MAHDCWSIWIDIEGFSKLWSKGDAGLNGMNSLITAIHAIGTNCFPDQFSRIFAHQFGDGFVIVSTFREEKLDRCAAAAISLMRYVSESGCMARAAIAEGQFADISGCWPKHIRDELSRSDRDNGIHIGMGLMTLIPVMGTALINANKLDKANTLRGSVLTLESCNLARLTGGFKFERVPCKPDLAIIDWVNSNHPFITEIGSNSGLHIPDSAKTASNLNRYIEDIKAHPELSDWSENSIRYNSIQV
jgi:hypothetical protein